MSEPLTILCHFCECRVAIVGGRLVKHYTRQSPSVVCGGSGKTQQAMDTILKLEAR